MNCDICGEKEEVKHIHMDGTKKICTYCKTIMATVESKRRWKKSREAMNVSSTRDTMSQQNKKGGKHS